MQITKQKQNLNDFRRLSKSVLTCLHIKVFITLQ